MDQLFIGGCGRSGTTLLGSMMGSHSRAVATPESRFLTRTYRRLYLAGSEIDAEHAWPHLESSWDVKVWGLDLAELDRPPAGAGYPQLIETLVRSYAARIGKPDPELWIDHTPGSVAHPIVLLDMFPSARFVHLVRDGRAVAASVFPLDWGPNTIDAAARWWRERVTMGIAAETFFGPSRAMRVHYEDLVRRPDETLERVCSFAGLDFQPEMVGGAGFVVPSYTRGQHGLVGQPPDPSRLTAWVDKLTPRQVEIFEHRAWQLLTGLGYELTVQGGAAPMSVTEKLRDGLTEALRDRRNQLRHRRRRRSVEER